VNSIVPSSYPATYTHTSGAEVALEAVPSPGYYFVRWSGDLTSDSISASVEMTCNKTVTAVFSLIMNSLTTSAEPGAGGMVIAEPPATPEGYVAGTEVTIAATANEGYQFSQWSGDAVGSNNPVTIAMDSDKELGAHFIPVPSFAWWLVAPIIGIIVIALPVYFRLIRRRVTSRK